MRYWFAQLDSILRGQATHPSRLQQGELNIQADGLLVMLTALGMSYGFCMSWYAVLRDDPQYMQVVASMIKVPLLFFLTLAVTFPSLYVFNALIGSRLSFSSMLQLLVGSQAVLLAVLASFGPIVAFFSVTSTSYFFILLLNVAVCGLAGSLGIRFLLQTLHRLTDALYVPIVLAAPEPAEAAPPDSAVHAAAPGPLTRIGRPESRERVRVVFYVWVATFAVVGGQMAWVLRPFIGNPNAPFTWFRPRQSNFLEAVVESVRRLFQP